MIQCVKTEIYYVPDSYFHLNLVLEIKYYLPSLSARNPSILNHDNVIQEALSSLKTQRELLILWYFCLSKELRTILLFIF